jgi:hypothetical protein
MSQWRTNDRVWTDKAVARELSKLYYSVGDVASYGGVNRLYARAKEVGIPVDRDAVAKYLSGQLSYSMHKPARHTFRRNHTYASRIDQQWQADLADMQSLAKQNDGYHYILTCIDVLSRYAWAVPVRSKSTNDMVIAMNRLFQLSQPRTPERLQTDKGKEFFNGPVSALLQKRNISHFASNSDKKAAVVERFNRTLKSHMWTYFTANETLRYVDVLQDFVRAYNHSVHRAIGMCPNDVVGDAAARKAWTALYYKDICGQRKPRKDIAMNKNARISRAKGEFEKGYMPNWSREHFVVRDRIPHPEPVYKLEDSMGEPLEGHFYESELNPIPEVTLQIERIVRRRKRGRRKEVLVKWLGFSDKFNRWIPASDTTKYQRTPAERATGNGV